MSKTQLKIKLKFQDLRFRQKLLQIIQNMRYSNFQKQCSFFLRVVHFLQKLRNWLKDNSVLGVVLQGYQKGQKNNGMQNWLSGINLNATKTNLPHPQPKQSEKGLEVHHFFYHRHCQITIHRQ